MIELIVEGVEVAALILLWVWGRSAHARLDKKIDGRHEVVKQTYVETNRRLSEHIVAPLHGRR